ncbi:MAG: protein kinase domain-containing protein [Isosphaeraceae bacterium]
MSATPCCPECGAPLPSAAPRGLCPNCLLNAGLAVADTSPAEGHDHDLDSIFPMASDAAAPANEAAVTQPALVPHAEFRQAVVELGLMDAGTFDRMTTGFASDRTGLARALARSGRVTVYQAAAIGQGKVRGLVVGDYLILDRLGQGGMGVVFKARHRRLGHVVALKILPPRLARDRKLVLRFRREIHAAALLDHPNIVAALDADEDRGVHFLTMQYIEGVDLDRFVKNGGAVPVVQSVDFVMQAARGLAAAHAQGIIHRDIKPGNLILDATGTVRVLDLGLALVREGAAQSAETAAMTLTQAGSYMGTVDFMAPEQAQDSHTVDHRADIYSLGCSLCFLLTGRPPFEGTTPLSRLIAHQQTPAPSLRGKRPDVSESLDAVYQAMMAKRPDDRPGSMTAVLARLETCLSPAAETVPASRGLMTLSGPVRNSDVPSGEVVASAPARMREGPGASEVIPVTNVPSHAAGYSLVESVASAPTALTPISALAVATKRYRFAVVSLLGGLAALAVIVAIYSLNRRDVDTRLRHDRPGRDLTAKTASEVAELRPPGADPEISEAVVNELSPAADVTPPATTKDQRNSSAIVASSSSRGTSTRDVPRTAKKPPDPVAKPAPSLASTAAVPTYNSVSCFRGHKGAVGTVAVSSDGKVALSAGVDRYARLWNIRTGVEISSAKHPSDVLDAAISGDGRFAFTCTKGIPKKHGGAVRFWNMSLSMPKALLTADRAHAGPINAVALFHNGRALSGGRDGRLVLWDLTTGKRMGILGQQNGSIDSHAVAFFPRGVRVATGGEDHRVHIWNVRERKEVATWPGHQGSISSIAISATGGRVATGGSDGTVILWDTRTGSAIHTFSMPDGDRNARVAILPDGNVLAAGNSIGHLILWDAKSGAVLRRSKGPFVKHGGLAVLPDGQRVLTADQDGVVRMWTPRAQ